MNYKKYLIIFQENKDELTKIYSTSIKITTESSKKTDKPIEKIIKSQNLSFTNIQISTESHKQIWEQKK